FAASQCDKLIVSMSYTDHDPITPDLRGYWLNEIFKDNPKISVNVVRDDFVNEALELSERTKIWADFIRRTYPRVDIIFSSEEYGDFFAMHLGAEHVVFDLQRNSLPISATAIRSNAIRYWDFIPDIVKPFFVKKICIYGPESTGKTTLAIRLAQKFDT